MSKKRERYEKGSIIEFLDGTVKLIKTSFLKSYEVVPIPDPDNPSAVRDYRINPYNQDYVMYKSHEIKDGMIPATSIKEMYEVKYRRIGNVTHVYNRQMKEIFTLS